MTRRDAIAALASTAALPVMASCGGGGAPAASTGPATPGDADALKLLDERGRQPAAARARERDLARHRHRRESGAAIRSWPIAPRRGSSASRRRSAPTWSASTRSTRTASRTPTRTSFEVVRSAYATALEGFALPYGDITVGGWRNTPYVVIQNVGAYLDIPRFLDSDHPNRERRRRRGVSRAAAVVCEAARRRARPDAGGARGRARAAGVPDRQGAGADDALGEERARRRVARRVDRAADRRTFPATGPSARGRSPRRRSRPRSSGSCANCRRSAPSPPTMPASRPVRTARSSTAGRSRPRPPRTCRRTRSTRWARASCSACTRRWTRS